MIRTQKITALFCALVLAVSSFGTYTDNAKAASKVVTPDDGAFFREITEKGTITGAGMQQLLSGKKVQGKFSPGSAGQKYQITLKSSGQLDIYLEGLQGNWQPISQTRTGKAGLCGHCHI